MFAHFKKLSLVFVILFISVIYTSNTFAQCSCSGKYRDITASKELELADAVFVGKVIEVHKTEPDKRNRYTETVRLEVKEFWKGELAETFTLVNEIYGCINGYDANEVFLIYAYKNKNGTYSTGCCCSRTTIISKAKKEFKEFKENGLRSQKINENQSQQNEPESNSISYCDLVRNPEKYDGKEVTVFASYRYGFEWQELYCLECQGLGKTWLEIDDNITSKTEKIFKKFPKDDGTINAIFTGTFESSKGPFGDGSYSFRFLLKEASQARLVSKSSAFPTRLSDKVKRKVCGGSLVTSVQ
ncbi:MAG: hypothetical protein M3405_14670 [Acidobacteriota bacterium]|jgi:hypothetical protein|nr:hypothetical protein [Acidobacteriota bacterium]